MTLLDPSEFWLLRIVHNVLWYEGELSDPQLVVREVYRHQRNGIEHVVEFLNDFIIEDSDRLLNDGVFNSRDLSETHFN